MFKFQITLCFLGGVALFVEGGVISVPVQEVDAYPVYNYGYSVQDPLTGDSKTQEESRDGHVVRGRYSLIEPDGSLRIVTYMADETGFHAVVERQAAFAPAPAPVQVVRPVAVRPVVQPVHVQVPFRPQPPPVQVVQQPHPVAIPAPQPAPQPQPIEVPAPIEPEPAPAPVEIPQPAPVEIPQPAPVEIPRPPPQQPQQPQPQPQPIQPPTSIPQLPVRPPQPEPPRPEENFDDAEIIEARRADFGIGQGSSVSFRSSRNGQHDFNFSF